MQAFGSDRVHSDKEGRIVLSCRIPKPLWHPRAEKTNTTSEHPGTAILWDEKYYEVVDVKPLAGTAVRYVLEPWTDHHVMRMTDRYDEESEAQRVSEHRAAILREKQRKGTNAMAILTGHLPAVVQERLASELGVNAPRLTLASILPPVLAFAICLHFTVKAVLAKTASPVPGWLWLIVGYMTGESILRAHIAWIQNRPV
jgi:hypothetical protein